MELIVDSFAGGGGASYGIELATGRSPDIAINHDAEAIALHTANHPTSRHYTEDVWKVDPMEATQGRPVGLMWLSPDCTHHSKARGAKPRKQKVRGLAWVAVRWAQAVRPRVICLENVEEFQGWGPLSRETQLPRADKKGATFRAFVAKLRKLGYEVQWRELRACDYGAPTIRKRLFLVARCDGQPIVWPKATHGKHLPYKWHTAAECINWSLTCPSIFARKKPLAENTLKRIAAGLRRYVIDSGRPFIVSLTHHGSDRIESIDAPFATITGAHRGEKALVTTFLTEHANASNQRNMAADEPLRTQCAQVKGGHFALVSAFLAKHYTERRASEVQAASLFDPVPTVTSVDHNALVAATITKMRGDNIGHAADEPLHTVSAQGTHFAEVRAYMVAYYGNEKDGASLFDPVRTVTSKERFGLVTVEGQEYQIADIGMRMLAPRELYRAQGFPDTYKIDIEYNGKPMTKTAQVRMCGNSVCPPVAAAIVSANYQAHATRLAA